VLYQCFKRQQFDVLVSQYPDTSTTGMVCSADGQQQQTNKYSFFIDCNAL